jgi:hypothetical protein
MPTAIVFLEIFFLGELSAFSIISVLHAGVGKSFVTVLPQYGQKAESSTIFLPQFEHTIIIIESFHK